MSETTTDLSTDSPEADSASDNERVVLVTGGGSGIGRACAELFAAGGDTVVVTDRHLDACGVVVEGIVERGGRAEAQMVDVTDEQMVNDVVVDVLARFGRLDAACNSAGTPGTYAALADQSTDDWERTVAVNLSGTFFCLRAQVPPMVAAKRGAVVNISSAAGLMGFANLPAYVASKHGVVGLTKSVALEVAGRGVRINAVCPGTIRTPMLEGFAGGDEEALQAMGRQTPMRRLGTPEEVAEAVVWLCSDAARFVTGQAMGVDGGVLAT